jgi:hypothetical protein
MTTNNTTAPPQSDARKNATATAAGISFGVGLALLLLILVCIGIHRRKHKGDNSSGGDGISRSGGIDGSRNVAVVANPTFARPSTVYDIPNIPSKDDGVAHYESMCDSDLLADVADVAAGSVIYSSDMVPEPASAGNNVYDVGAPLKLVNNDGVAHYETVSDSVLLAEVAAGSVIYSSDMVPEPASAGNNVYDVGAPLKLVKMDATEHGVESPSATGWGGESGVEFGDAGSDGSLPPPGRNRRASGSEATLATGAQCQRPSPKGGTCKNGAVSGGLYCQGHTCSFGGCTEGKSSVAVACALHSREGDSSEMVDDWGFTDGGGEIDL